MKGDRTPFLNFSLLPWILCALALFHLGSFSHCQTVKCYYPLEFFPQPTSVPEFSFAAYSHPFSQLQSEVLNGIHSLVTAKWHSLGHNFLTYLYTSRFLPYVSRVSPMGTSYSTCPKFKATLCNNCCVFYLRFGANKHLAIKARKPGDGSSSFTLLQIMSKFADFTSYTYNLVYTCAPFSQSL